MNHHITGALLIAAVLLMLVFLSGLLIGVRADPPALLAGSAVTCYADPDSLHSTGGQQIER